MIVTVGVLQRLQIPGLVEADSQYFDEKVVEKMQLTLMILGDLSSDYKPIKIKILSSTRKHINL